MAQPIPLRVAPRPAENTQPQTAFLSQHADALASTCELLQILHDRGVLNLLRGLVGAGNNVVGAVAEAADTPEAIRAVRNFLLLSGFFASIPPEVLSNLVQAAAAGAQKEKSQKAPGILELVRRMRSENVRHTVSVMLDLIESVGKGL